LRAFFETCDLPKRDRLDARILKRYRSSTLVIKSYSSGGDKVARFVGVSAL
jgi:hypothetical protein